MATPVALALNDAMIRTLAEYFKQALPIELEDESDPVGYVAHVEEGWPSIAHDLVYPTVTVDAPVLGQRLSSIPIPIVVVEPAEESDPSIEVYYHVGSVQIPLQVNVFAESKEQRSRVLHALEVALQGDVMRASGALELESSYYYGLSIGYLRDAPFQNIDTESSVGGDEWRAVGTILAEAHEIARVKTSRFLDLKIDWRVARVGELDSVPGEIVTYFAP